MIKCFYKKTNKCKTFFNKNLKFRSIAYGDDIFNSYLDWLNYYKQNWDNIAKGFWIFKRGDITNNCFRGNKTFSKFSYNSIYTEKEVDYITKPLFLLNHCYLINQEGFLLIDNNRSLHIGDVKAWAIMTFANGLNPNIVTLTDTEDKNKLQLSLFNITNERVQKSNVPNILIDSNSGKNYCIYCFGNHIFLLHDAMLCYYYYNNVENVFEEVCIGENDENRSEFIFNVCTELIADYSGNIYWGAGNSLFSFKIGSPNLVNKIDVLSDYTIFNISVFDKKLFVTYGNVANGVYQTVYYENIENAYIKKYFLSDVERLVFIDKIDEKYKYVKFCDKKAQIVGQNSSVMDSVDFNGELNGMSFFLINDILVRNLVSFGCDVDKNYYIIKEKS